VSGEQAMRDNHDEDGDYSTIDDYAWHTHDAVVAFAAAADRVLKLAVQPTTPLQLREEIQKQLLGTNFAGVCHTRRSRLPPYRSRAHHSALSSPLAAHCANNAPPLCRRGAWTNFDACRLRPFCLLSWDLVGHASLLTDYVTRHTLLADQITTHATLNHFVHPEPVCSSQVSGTVQFDPTTHDRDSPSFDVNNLQHGEWVVCLKL
jgi:hypothetical protein